MRRSLERKLTIPAQEEPDRTLRPQSREKYQRLDLLPFTIRHLLFTALIGSDRSAFAAGRHKVAGQSKTTESSECSIHDEGLLEHPIKS
jgi:hypothetical protein